MSEYIDRDKIFSTWRSIPAPGSLTSLAAAIAQTPAEDVAPVRHGSWENLYGDFRTAECIVCKSQFEVAFGEESNGALWDGFCQSYRYCPNCGTRMDGKEPDNEHQNPPGH